MVSEKYFFGDVEPINSKLAGEPALRTHILSIISTGGIQHRGEIGDFLSATFLGFSTPKHILKEKIDQTLTWLTEERFIRKIGVDRSYSEARADKIVDSDDWDDNVPAWAMVAKSTHGVELNNETMSSDTNKFTAHNKPALGFNLASELSSVGAWHSNELDEFSGMKYEATMMGERITQLYLDPL